MAERLRDLLAARHGDAIALLARLVEQGSFTEDVAGGARVASMLVSELASIEGVSAALVPSESGRFAPHVVASTRAAEASAEGAVVLVGHLDTVFPPGHFEGFRLDGPLAAGPGVLDMKGGLVVILEALRALAAMGVLGAIPVRLCVVSDEEVGSPEGREVIARHARGASAALVFEAGRAGDVVITARKGTASARAVATGKAAHAGNAHDKGANAIWALARFVERAQSLTDYARGVTVNVGTIGGGSSKNTVPERAEAALDLRFVTPEDGEALVASLESAARDAAASVPGTAITLGRGPARAPLVRCDANVALYRAYAACARAAGLGEGEAKLLGGGSDASTTAALGLPSIDGLGPRGSGFHTTDEVIEVATLAPKAEALGRFLLAHR
jgi:glutamate carboxypeptidase